MAALPLDIQLLVQTILYFSAALAGVITSVPTGFTTTNFGGYCILYAGVNWFNATSFTVSYGSSIPCHFAVYVTVFACILYGIGMGAYHGYATYQSTKDSAIALQMWVMPFILANSLIAMLTFISSCIVSVGFTFLCNSFIGGKDKGAAITSCASGQSSQWTPWWKPDATSSVNNSTYFNFMTVAQTTSWITFLIWAVQIALCALRFYRNRKARSREEFQGEINPSDTAYITRQDPTA